MKKLLAGFVVLMLLLPLALRAQNNQALEFMNDGKYGQAVDVIENLRLKNSAALPDLVNLAYCYIMLHDYVKAESIYAEVVANKKAEPRQFFFYGELSRINGKYTEAKQWYQEFLKTYPEDRVARLRVQSCDSLLKWSAMSSALKVENMAQINTPDDETCPFALQSELAWVTNNREQHLRYNIQTQFSSPQLSFILGLDEPMKAFRPFSDSVSYSYFTSSGATRALVIKTVKKTPDGEVFGTPLIMIGTIHDGFDEFIPEGLSAGYVCNHPCLARNGDRLYFASNMPGGQGGVDLWYSDRHRFSWSAPVNLGPEINTPGDEMFPFVDVDETLLYFASDGHPGYGNLDVFCAALKDGAWTSPRNMRAPVNSIGNDFSLSMNGTYSGYFVSNRYEGAKGRNDIYRLRIPEPPKMIDTVKPPVVLLVPSDTNFLFFRTASAKIDPVFEESLQQAERILKEKTYLKLNVHAWADERGSEKINSNLCLERAEAVRAWMSARGIDASRIVLQPEGVTKNAKLISENYHVRIGFMPGSDLAGDYEKNIRGRASVHALKYGSGYVYVAGKGTKAAMISLRRELRNSFGIEGYVTASWNGYHMEDTRFAPCRRAMLYFSK